jgi:hypothetical protein
MTQRNQWITNAAGEKRRRKWGLNVKKLVAILISLGLLWTGLPGASAAGVSFSDHSGHWAEEAINKWSGYEIIRGYEGKFRPDDPITRGEMAVILDRLMQYQVAADNVFTDLGTDFYAEAVRKANAAGVMLGYEDKVRPADSITRQDAFVMIARALEIREAPGYTLKAPDAGDISDYAIASVAAMESLGMIHGRPDGKLYPRDTITRAEVVQVLENIIAKLYTAPGTYSEDVSGYVIVSAPDVIFQDMTINGTLVVAPGVGDGDCTLSNVHVTGNVVVLGGGSHSVQFMSGSSVAGSVIIDKVGDEVRVYVGEGINLADVIVDEKSGNVTLAGSFQNVTVNANVTVTLPKGTTVGSLKVDAPASVAGSGTVGTATISEKVTGNVSLQGTYTNVEVKATANVSIPAGTTVSNLTVEAKASITGTGTVKNALVTSAASGATFETKPEKMEVAAGATANVAGTEMDSTNDDVGAQPSGSGDDTMISVTKVTLHFSNSAKDIDATPAGTGVLFDISDEGAYVDSLSITGITITTSGDTRYYVGSYSIATNAKEPMSSMLSMAGIDPSAQVTLGKIRSLGQSVTISGSISGGSALSVTFRLATTGYYTITNNGTTVTARLSGDASIASFSGTNDPVAILIRNLDPTAALYKLETTKTGTGLTVLRNTVRTTRSKASQSATLRRWSGQRATNAPI